MDFQLLIGFYQGDDLPNAPRPQQAGRPGAWGEQDRRPQTEAEGTPAQPAPGVPGQRHPRTAGQGLCKGPAGQRQAGRAWSLIPQLGCLSGVQPPSTSPGAQS